jgi:hypothetical protein
MSTAFGEIKNYNAFLMTPSEKEWLVDPGCSL